MNSQPRKHGNSRRLFAIERLEDRRLLTADFRSIDGSNNNLLHSDWGQADTQLLRLVAPDYEDDIGEPAGGFDGSGRPNPRLISNAIVSQREDIPNDRFLTNFVFQWGQFLDHDLGLTEGADPAEPFDIGVPDSDPTFVPGSSISVKRSIFDPNTGTEPSNPRQQVNEITAFIDASNVYGSDAERAAALRTNFGGQLKTSDGNLLPYNEDGLPNASPLPLAKTEYFLAGDVRANEQPGLTAMHTLFVREHNRLAAEIASSAEFVGADLADEAVDELIYQKARQIVGAQMQSITYNEFLPALLGPTGVAGYDGYRQDVNPGIANIFSGALYRVGHTMLPQQLEIYNNDGSPMGHGAVGLDAAFFNPIMISGNESTAGYGIEPFLMGLSKQRSQEIDPHVVDSMRNMQMGPGGQFDLAAINMQRGRDHGLPDYNQARIGVGLSPVTRFSEITSDRSLARKLDKVYGRDLNNIDVWLGGISEDHIPGGSVGELVRTVLVDQFERLRDGDRFYFESAELALEEELIREINETRLSDIIQRNSTLDSLQAEVFRDPSVFVFRTPSDLASNITIEVKGGKVRILDSNTSDELDARRLSDVQGLVIFASSQDDRISFDDSIERLRKPIEVHGGGGQDRLILIGSSARDQIVIEETVVHFNNAYLVFGNMEQIEVDARGGNDAVFGRDSSVPLILGGGSGNDFLVGSRHDDFISGQGGADTILGLDGNDLLLGGRGADFILGGRGNDTLVGGKGRDFLFGGLGNDLLINDVASVDDLATEPFRKWRNEFGKYEE